MLGPATSLPGSPAFARPAQIELEELVYVNEEGQVRLCLHAWLWGQAADGPMRHQLQAGACQQRLG
jgi:hypothetical protein